MTPVGIIISSCHNLTLYIQAKLTIVLFSMQIPNISVTNIFHLFLATFFSLARTLTRGLIVKYRTIILSSFSRYNPGLPLIVFSFIYNPIQRAYITHLTQRHLVYETFVLILFPFTNAPQCPDLYTIVLITSVLSIFHFILPYLIIIHNTLVAVLSVILFSYI